MKEYLYVANIQVINTDIISMHTYINTHMCV